MHPKVLAISLDAAEPRLIEQWMNDGSLPNLKMLHDRGCSGRLNSTADWLAGSPWPTFYTGTLPSHHGIYHYLQWDACEMTYNRPSSEWLSVRPFWRDLSDQNIRVIVIDVPMTYAPEPIDGLEIMGWATQDRLAPPASYPPSLLTQISHELGPPPLVQEIHGLQSIKSLLNLRNRLLQNTERVAELAKVLMSREKWDFFMVNFGATHLGGHKLWDLSGAMGNFVGPERADFSSALLDVYTTCDSAVGQLIDRVGKDVTVLVFSLHGMGANSSRSIVLSSMLDQILVNNEHNGRLPKRKSILQFFRELFPLEIRQRIKNRLPLNLQDKLSSFWRIGKVDWAGTSAFSLLADLQGYIRINLSGREAKGIVSTSEEYDLVCSKIIEGIETYIDVDAGEAVVDEITRSDQVYPGGSRIEILPDIIVRWRRSPVSKCRAIESTKYGSIKWPTPGHNPDGRSGNHLPEGFIIAAGDQVNNRSKIEEAHIIDLAPTIFKLFDIPEPGNLCGNRINNIA